MAGDPDVVHPATAARRRAAARAAGVAAAITSAEFLGGVASVRGLVAIAAIGGLVAGGWEWVRVGDALAPWHAPLPVPDGFTVEDARPRQRRIARSGLVSVVALAVLLAVAVRFGGDGFVAGTAVGGAVGRFTGLWRVRRAERRLGLRLLEGTDGDGDPVFYRDSPKTAAAAAPPRTLPGIPA